MATSKSNHLKLLLVVLDSTVSTAIAGTLFTAAYLIGYFDLDALVAHMLLLPVIILVSYTAGRRFQARVAGTGWIRIVGELTRMHLTIFAVLVAVVFLLKLTEMSRLVILVYVLSSFTVLVLVRLFLSWWYFSARVERQENDTKVLVIGSGPRAENFISSVPESSEWGTDIIGCLDPDKERVGGRCADKTVLGTIDDIKTVVADHVVDELVIALPRSKLNDIDLIVDTCVEEGIELKLLADFYEFGGGEIHLERLADITLLSFRTVQQDEGMLLVKRIMDIVILLLALPLLIPVFIMVMVAVRLSSPGPVFFLQNRVGLHKRRFNMIKFRSMYQDAEQRLAELEHLNEASGPIFKMANDPRVTPLGRFLRRTSLDELPQLINVLKGDMSLVGPRPMSLRDVSLFDKGVQRKRFSVRPGVACLREISGRSQLTFDRWLELDLQYIDEWSLALDLQILVRAIPAVLRGDGAS